MMLARAKLLIGSFLLLALPSLSAAPLADQFKKAGCVEICDRQRTAVAFDALYVYFDAFIEALQKNPLLAHKLYGAKERFLRSKDRNLYSTDTFGFFDESNREGRHQVAFYYSTHLHAFISSRYPELSRVPEIARFLDACLEIQKPYGHLFEEAAAELGLGAIFSTHCQSPPILLKVIKYLPSYTATRPHYDGSAFSLFLDSTNYPSLLLCPYKASYAIEDFSSPIREFSRTKDQNSILLIPGTLLAEFSIDPTPHIVTPSGKVRYATIAFAMRAHYVPHRIEHSPLPTFKPKQAD